MRTARVAVIDEDAEEALALISALGKAGIGAVYFKGDDPDQFPDEPIDGIRLVFLDLKLINTPETKDYIPLTVNALTQAVYVTPGVTGIICWTKHTDDIEALKSELESRGIKPAFVDAFDDKLELSKPENIQPLLGEIGKIVAKSPGRRLITAWEQASHDATSAATANLLQISDDEDQLMTILGAVANATADERIERPPQATAALGSGLVALQADELEAIVETSGIEGPIADKLFSKARGSRKTPPDPEQRAWLNKVLMTAQARGAQPGTIYLPRTWEPTDNCPVECSDNVVVALIREFFPQESAKKHFLEGVQSTSTQCLLELTPACDFAQGKCSSARLLEGLLIFSDGNPEIEQLRDLPAGSRIFAKQTPYIMIHDDELGMQGSHKLILNARRLVTVQWQQLADQRPLCRLRHQVTADFRAWFAAHTARPGFVSIP